MTNNVGDPVRKTEQTDDSGQEDARRRMSPEEREEMILKGAVHFFAKHGLEARTRDLSKALNVSQPLIYRYFGSKEELMERVYQYNFLSRWREEWITVLSDRSVPLGDRLKAFYRSYIDAIDSFDWIRLTLFSGLAGKDLTKRYIETNVNQLLCVIASESQQEVVPGAPAIYTIDQLDDLGHEQVWHLHSTVVYYLMRKHVYKTRIVADYETLIDAAVDSYLKGLR